MKNWPVTLYHDALTLRPLRTRDEAAWFETRERNRAWLRPWDATEPPESRDHGLSFHGMVRQFTAAARAGRMLPWVLEYAIPQVPDGVFAGQMTISGITYGSARWAMAGYWVDQRFAGRGLAPLALAMATDYCFSVLRLHRMEVAIRPENHNSLRVVQKLGFRYEGERRRYLHVHGDWRDHSMFALHREECTNLLVDKLAGRDSATLRQGSAD